jgi:hypothetical protein
MIPHPLWTFPRLGWKTATAAMDVSKASMEASSARRTYLLSTMEVSTGDMFDSGAAMETSFSGVLMSPGLGKLSF